MLPTPLQRLVELFASSPKQIKVQALVDYSDRLATPPPDVIGEGKLEQVHECQTPFFVATDVDAEGIVHLHFDVPREAPTMRGYAGILSEGLRGASVEEILAIPETFYLEMGLAEVVSQLRLRGMAAIMGTIKAQLRAVA